MRGMGWEGEDWWAKRFSQRQAKEVRNKKRSRRMTSLELHPHNYIITTAVLRQVLLHHNLYIHLNPLVHSGKCTHLSSNKCPVPLDRSTPALRLPNMPNPQESWSSHRVNIIRCDINNLRIRILHLFHLV
jgi:hypothetical protein